MSRLDLRQTFRHLPGTWRAYIELVDLRVQAGDQDMARYMDCWLALTPEERRNHIPEQVCAHAGITPGELAGAVCRALWERGIRRIELRSL
jgi:hypothetical protein